MEKNNHKYIRLDNLYLDPNNYRFADNKDYIKIDNNELLYQRIQKRTRNFLEGNKRENIKDLISSFKTNGFLDVDVIQVRDLGNNNYLVLEGNRRVATLKALQEDYENSLDIGILDPDIFQNVPTEVHGNDDNEKHLIVMGLKHINGNQKWSAINQAKLIYDYLKPYWQNDNYIAQENKLCSSLGISTVKLRTSQRAYHLVLAYQKSDYGDQFDSDKYNTFVEIVRTPKIKEWLSWDDTNYTAKNIHNQERLFSWLSKREEFDEENNEDDTTQTVDPIITKTVEIRDLTLFIDNENALIEMEKSKSISRALAVSGTINRLNYDKILRSSFENLKLLRNYKEMLTKEDLMLLKNDFEEIIPKKSFLDLSRGNISICFEHGHINHFDSITINQYKIFKNFTIDKLNRINIFAGFNNSGKSSLLEAVYFLTKQNDIVAFLETIKLRNKLNSLDPVWLNEVFAQEDVIDIKGVFNSVETSIRFNKFEASNIDKKDDYLASYKLNAILDDRVLDNTIHTFKFDKLKRENEKVEHLCNSILKSPYFYNLKEVIETYSKNTVFKTKENRTAIKLVIEFIKSEIDPTIEDMRLYDVEDIERFIVDSTKFSDKNLEITNYGEGLQRIFELALAFAFSRNGVVCIDEFETAIHYSLLIKFTEFIQKLANEFNVQVFITSHSKECIDAFVSNGYNNDEISFYTMVQDENQNIQTIYYNDRSLLNELSQDLEVRGW